MKYASSFTWFLVMFGVVALVAVGICCCLEWYFSRKERALKLRRAIADAEWLVGLRDLGELGASASGIYEIHPPCGNRLRVGNRLVGSRVVLYCPFCVTEVACWSAEEIATESNVLPFDPLHRSKKIRHTVSKPPPTAA